MTEKAKKTANNTAKNTANMTGEGTPPDRRYGQIGISAVAAAVRYQGAAKNPAYAPAPNRWDDREEAA
jgi:hypothetical protein